MNRHERHSWVGILLVALGGLLIIDNFGIFNFDFRHIVFSWHTIMLVIGIIILSNSKNSTVGIIFVLIGIWGYATHVFPWFGRIVFGDLWPLILIIVGLSLLLRRKSSPRKDYNYNYKYEYNYQNNSTTGTESTTNTGSTTNIGSESHSSENQSTDDILDEVAIFTTTRRYIMSQNFRGGKVTSIFGGNHLDFAKAKLANGENQLEIACIFGGCKIYVPREWKVIVNVTSIFGGIDDKRYINFDYPTSEGVLIIKGAVVFGGCEILSV